MVATNYQLLDKEVLSETYKNYSGAVLKEAPEPAAAGVPVFLPVGLQDIVYRCQPGMREQQTKSS